MNAAEKVGRIVWIGCCMIGLQGCDPTLSVDTQTASQQAAHCIIAEDNAQVRRVHGRWINQHRYPAQRALAYPDEYRVQACINCHVPESKNDQAVRITHTETHFCATCHTYVAVRLDCFECHADRPASVYKIPSDRPLN